ncbi:hypothetical protein COU61_02490 [Candidatus Pacearchaeota archaeon CG10_big_fil_rev_8_21_14_0_10_35_13]|nr:MAG: hypothetical protein COU61_02490 [Candidatus Pacearchaeota archaeon CG10_big_fil_rev_8_21_14_0_10_35_13]
MGDEEVRASDDEGLERIRELFGEPIDDSGKTDCRIGGPWGVAVIRLVFDEWTRTGYRIGGRGGNRILDEDLKPVGMIGGRHGKDVLTLTGERTGYFLGGISGQGIYYDEGRREG